MSQYNCKFLFLSDQLPTVKKQYHAIWVTWLTKYVISYDHHLSAVQRGLYRISRTFIERIVP